MEALVEIVDETAAGERSPSTFLRLVSETVTVEDVIRARVQQEVAEYNQDRNGIFRGFVQPTDAEHTLNGFRLQKRRNLDSGEQVRTALEAFETNGFFMLFNGRQVESLDQRLLLTGKDVVSFVKLLPLIGG